jgi:biotin-dependent carboxylase-like uncharacterized protein
MPALHVHRPGLLTTVQDLGRPGMGRFGVSPSGAMDPLALRVANRLVDNPDGAAALEITAVGPELGFDGRVRFALGGANLSPSLDGEPIAVWRSYLARSGQRLTFGPRRQGARCILAVAGGIAAPRVFGSAAADLEAGLGAPPLRAGDVLEVGKAGEGPAREARPALLAAYADPFTLRFLADQWGEQVPERLAVFTGGAYRVSRRSNRMGFRLEGAAPPGDDGERLSEPIPPGTIQVPAGGEPILLMADRPTVGGYPRLGCVIAADLPKAGQLWIGHQVRFRAVARDEARAALARLGAQLETAVRP